MITLIEQALAAHRNNQLEEALRYYTLVLNTHPTNPVALYGVGSISLLKHELWGLDYIKKALCLPIASILDRAQASASTIQALLQLGYKEAAWLFLEECITLAIPVQNQAHYIETLPLPAHLKPQAFDYQLGRNLSRYTPFEGRHYVYAIDVVGGCNLRCPTCPVSHHKNLPKGLMDLDLFQKILHKIQLESIDPHPEIWLFNWTEPLLHPDLPQFIRAVKALGLRCSLSSNLNASDRLEGVMAANPDYLKISLSSFKQEIYGQTHVRGNIERVKANMRVLARLREQYQATTQIVIGHHLYRHTLNEQAEIAQFAAELGFQYTPSTAIVAPIEEVMKMIATGESTQLGDLRNQLLYDPVELAQHNGRYRSGQKDCELRFNMTAIQYDGQLNLCCGTTQKLGPRPLYFLEHSFEDIEKIKYNNTFCKKCMGSNLHLTIADR